MFMLCVCGCNRIAKQRLQPTYNRLQPKQGYNRVLSHNNQ